MADKNNGTVTLMTGGDIGPVYKPTEEFAELIAPVMQHADIRLGQCERTYSIRGHDPQFAEILKFTEWVSDQHLHKFRVEGNEVVVETAV